MIGEVNIYGVLFPPLLIWIGIALVLSMGIRRLISASGLYRYVWHRPLFDVCLLVMLTGLVSLAANRYF
ncbi:DUF1656 domain-containing protein [Acidocella sp.]|uniref:DUF1656 domain-containing protein n=1 Tax=Acidocella sp. TaxID=50710 RepID=UPI003D022945